MKINYNDRLEVQLSNFEYYNKNINPFYGTLISFLLEIGFCKLDKDDYGYYQISKIETVLKNNPNLVKEILRKTISNGFSNYISFRYQFSNILYKTNGDESRSCILKYKIIDEKLYVYDRLLSPDNRKYIEVKEINNVNSNDIIKLLEKDGYSYDEIEILIHHKEILEIYGVKSDSYNIVLSNENNIINLQLDNPDIKFNFKIFYKEHTKSKLLDKSNFILNTETNNKPKSYGYDSNLQLLSLMHGLCKNPNDLSLFEKIYKQNINTMGLGNGNDFYLDWMFISSFFLLNQEEKSELPDYLYSKLNRDLKLIGPHGAMCIFLDENGNEISDGDNVNSNNYGCNEYIMDGNKINCKTLFHVVRNALAHSSYEVIDKDYIRIYGYNNETMNCNFKIKKDIIIEFIDKLSSYNNFGNIFPICTLEIPNYSNESIKNKNDLEKYLSNIIISDVKNVKYNDSDFLKKLNMYATYVSKKETDGTNKNIDYKWLEQFEHDFERKTEFFKASLTNPTILKTEYIESLTKSKFKYFMNFNFENSKLSNEQINKILKQIEQISDTFYNHGAHDQHQIITELIRNELNPSRNISSILKDIIKTKNKSSGSIMDMLNKKTAKYIDYDKVIKATVIAYLNNILLYNYNEKRIDSSALNFSSMNIDLNPRINDINKRIDDLIKQINNIKNNHKNSGKIKQLTNMLKNPHLDDVTIKQFEDEKQNLIIERDEDFKLDVIVNECSQEINELKLELKTIEETGILDNDYILRHLRNSIAHGNILFSDIININDISNIEITFIDYSPGTQTESFKGKIKLWQLLEILNEEKFINSLFSDINEKKLN